MAFTSTLPVSIEWKDTHIKLLDQQLLPQETVFIELYRIEDVYDAISSLKVRGAPAIGIAAAYGLALAAKSYDTKNVKEFLAKLSKDKGFLAESRPTAVNLFWALDRLFYAAQKAATVNEAKTILIHEAIQIQLEDEETCKQIGENALTLFQKHDHVLTICNAGSIATARYGTALAPFHLAVERDFPLKVFACETRPVLQGARLTAWELQQAGVDVTLITDNMAAHTIKTKSISAIIVGADRITANGDTANKIGTYGLAILAKAFDIPFYVAAPLSTFDITKATGEDIIIEERSTEEVTNIGGKRIAPENIAVFNPAFDVTPHDLISAIITEDGILAGNYSESIAGLFSQKDLS